MKKEETLKVVNDFWGKFREALDDGKLESNGRTYKLHIMPIIEKKKLLAIVNRHLESGVSLIGYIMEDKNFSNVEQTIFNYVTFENAKLTDEHFEKFQEDYIAIVTSSLFAYVSPFFHKGNGGK